MKKDDLELRFWQAALGSSQACYLNAAISMIGSSVRMKAELDKTKSLVSHYRQMADYYKSLSEVR